MRALILVDLQNDFMPGGPLGVKNGDETIAVANRLVSEFDIVVVTQDWHPADHGSFAANHPGGEPGHCVQLDGLRQILWPTHCVEDTPGAALHPNLDRSRIVRLFPKGTDPNVDSYSGFFDNGRRRTTGLAEFLKQQQATDTYVCGLATDYCVKHTALDAAELGFQTCLIEDACRGVNLEPGDVDRAIGQMRDAGVKIINSKDIPT